MVFDSDMEGKHYKGNGKVAVEKWGAIKGQAEGLQGNSYAIITRAHGFMKDRLPVRMLAQGIDRFKEFARAHPDMIFLVSAMGVNGFNSFKIWDVAPLFWDVPENVMVPDKFW